MLKAIIFCVGIKTYKKQGLGWKPIKTISFYFWYFCRKAALWEAYREKFCDAESFCWYVIFLSFGQQDGYEVKSVWALGKIMRPQPLWGVYRAFSIELEVMAVHWTACTSRVFIHFCGYMKKHKAAAHVFPTCWRSIGPPLGTEWCSSGSGNV